MKYLLSLFTVLGVVIAIGGCNSARQGAGSQDNEKIFGKLDPQEKSLMNYQYISARIIGPKCVNCHGSSGGVSLQSYERVSAHLADIKRSVFEVATMPKRGSLTEDEKRLLWHWIQLGGPRTQEDTTLPPSEEPLLATFESIDKKIFQVKCIDCHNPTGEGKRVPLDKESLLNSPLELVIPGNSEESGLVLAITRQDDKRMPPEEDGYSELSEEEKAAVVRWIDNGAID